MITQVLNDFANAQRNEPQWYKGCHAWALGNFEAISHYERKGDLERLEAHLGPAVCVCYIFFVIFFCCIFVVCADSHLIS